MTESPGIALNKIRWDKTPWVVVVCKRCGEGLAVRNPKRFKGFCGRCQVRRYRERVRSGG